MPVPLLSLLRLKGNAMGASCPFAVTAGCVCTKDERVEIQFLITRSLGFRVVLPVLSGSFRFPTGFFIEAVEVGLIYGTVIIVTRKDTRAQYRHNTKFDYFLVVFCVFKRIVAHVGEANS